MSERLTGVKMFESAPYRPTALARYSPISSELYKSLKPLGLVALTPRQGAQPWPAGALAALSLPAFQVPGVHLQKAFDTTLLRSGGVTLSAPVAPPDSNGAYAGAFVQLGLEARNFRVGVSFSGVPVVGGLGVGYMGGW